MMKGTADQQEQDKERLAIMAVTDLAEIEEKDLTCCLCLKRIEPEEFNDLATVPFITGKLGLFFCSTCHVELKGLKEVNYAKYYALLQLMEEKILELRKENRKSRERLSSKKRNKQKGKTNRERRTGKLAGYFSSGNDRKN